jgi:hypothetical protein
VVDAYADHHGVHQLELQLEEESGALSFVRRPDAPGVGGRASGSPTTS